MRQYRSPPLPLTSPTARLPTRAHPPLLAPPVPTPIFHPAAARHCPSGAHTPVPRRPRPRRRRPARRGGRCLPQLPHSRRRRCPRPPLCGTSPFCLSSQAVDAARHNGPVAQPAAVPSPSHDARDCIAPLSVPTGLLLCSPSWDRERHVARVNTVTCLDTGPSQSTRCQSADPAAARQILRAARNIIWEGRALHSGTTQLWGTVTRASQTSTECELLPVLRSEAICM